MEPRELWERHTVLARAFCQSDEEVRSAQTTLDDAQASRARSLAAFAVVVGNDKAVAEMLGLPEREVRIARRTVGRDDARSLADDLLMAPLQHQHPGPGPGADENARASEAAHPHAHTQTSAPAGDHMQASDQTQPQPQYQAHGQQQQQAPQAQQMPSQAHVQYQAQHQQQVQQQVQHHAAQSYYQSQEHYQQPQEHFQTYDHAQLPDHMGWSPVQDAVLVDGWQSGVDLEILALELGTDLRRLTARAQYLSAQGRLFVAQEETGRQGGKHRRETATHHTGIPTQQMNSPGDVLLPDGLVPDGYGGYWANWNEMLPAPQA
ncbi:hypothetical protein [Streptomyces sp. WMMB 322]|uniref:hypothetical protein n=1 Tax=Streptomyces sp. WMMB 322 TaxID=1286821 RepID=UPI0006E1372C|nr:hypothetical protein [Streptomyces sp. WMMB 322]SCK47761.1 hypothetical protein H180DRAFT_04275 [Streptomyces sp. WMMB 322]